MLAAYDLDNRSSAVLPQTVLSLGFKPSRRVEILTTGRSRRRRHRGGTREQELAEAARQRDDRAERRAAQAEQEQQELSVVSQLDELVLNVISRECVYLCNCPTFEATPTKCP